MVRQDNCSAEKPAALSSLNSSPAARKGRERAERAREIIFLRILTGDWKYSRLLELAGRLLRFILTNPGGLLPEIGRDNSQAARNTPPSSRLGGPSKGQLKRPRAFARGRFHAGLPGSPVVIVPVVVATMIVVAPVVIVLPAVIVAVVVAGDGVAGEDRRTTPPTTAPTPPPASRRSGHRRRRPRRRGVSASDRCTRRPIAVWYRRRSNDQAGEDVVIRFMAKAPFDRLRGRRRRQVGHGLKVTRARPVTAGAGIRRTARS